MGFNLVLRPLSGARLKPEWHVPRERCALLPSTLQFSGLAPVATASWWGRRGALLKAGFRVPLPERGRDRNEGPVTLSHITEPLALHPGGREGGGE